MLVLMIRKKKLRVIVPAASVIAVTLLFVGSGLVQAKSDAASPAFVAADFPSTPTSINTFFPLTPGNQSVQQGALNRGHRRLPHRRVLTVTGTTKEIAGVTTVLILDQDFDGGELAEQAVDYVAEDRKGNVWYLGSYTEAYEGGQFVNANDAWLVGVRGAKAGILMPSTPTKGAPRYVQAVVPGEGAATARVTKTGQSACVPFRCFDGVIVTEENSSEIRMFAPGVGVIKTQPTSGREQETEELINFTKLTGSGLVELSDEARRLDDHAHVTSKSVFGTSSKAKRAG